LSAAYRAQYPDVTLAVLRERFLSDAIYIVPSWRMAAVHAKAGGAAYFYQFTWTPPFEGGRLGAAHGFDEPFLWGVADAARVPFTKGAEDEAVQLARAMSRSLIRFVRTGDPGWSAFDTVQVFGGTPANAVDIPAIAEAWRGVERP
jgi:para-nitrobenzyl esterase